jgi:hypothetical protein
MTPNAVAGPIVTADSLLPWLLAIAPAAKPVRPLPARPVEAAAAEPLRPAA